jgi:hypothetical protein
MLQRIYIFTFYFALPSMLSCEKLNTGVKNMHLREINLADANICRKNFDSQAGNNLNGLAGPKMR